MNDFNPHIHQACLELNKAPRPPLTAYHFVSFAAYAMDAASPDGLTHVQGGTSIVPAFKLVRELLGKRGTPKQVDIVFISDGEDENMQACQSELDRMPPLSCHCRLFCVGVKAQFPTNLVSDFLYAKFGWGSDLSAPAVIPLEGPSETQSVFRLLAGYLREPKGPPAPGAGDITDAMSAAELSWAAKAVSDFTHIFTHVFNQNQNHIRDCCHIRDGLHDHNHNQNHICWS
jgi:hypothetical protein